jgi:hypothetical protein
VTRRKRYPELEAFERHRVKHPSLEKAESELLDVIAEPGDATLAVLAGPTGVGKSTLAIHALATLHEEWADEIEMGWVPILPILTPPAAASGFSMRDFYVAGEKGLSEPGIEHKLDFRPAGVDLDPSARRRRPTESSSRDAFLSALEHRHVRMIVADEGHHFSNTGGEAHIKSELESLKYLGMASGVLIVLIGTYELSGLIHLSGQLSRRTEIVHFPRYRADATDFEAFVHVIRDLEAHLGTETFPFEEAWKVLHAVSLGRVGTLKLRIQRAMAKALSAGRPLRLGDLELNPAERQGLAKEQKEISAGEKSFSTEPIPELAPGADVIVPPQKSTEPRVPFRRNPKRDPVGPRGSDRE